MVGTTRSAWWSCSPGLAKNFPTWWDLVVLYVLLWQFSLAWQYPSATLFLWWFVGVCSQLANLSKLIQSNSTCQVGSVFRPWRVGLGYKKNFDSGSGWVLVIKFQTHQTQPDLPIYLIYIINYIINKIFKITNSSHPI